MAVKQTSCKYIVFVVCLISSGTSHAEVRLDGTLLTICN